MRNLVYQVYVGSGHGGLNQKIIKASTNSARLYAERCGAEYIFENDAIKLKDSIIGLQCPQQLRGTFLEYTYYRLNLIYDTYFDQYDNILYLDTDIIADANAENIFEIKDIKFNTDIVGANQWGWGIEGCWQAKELHEFSKHFDAPLAYSKEEDREFRLIQAGVMLFTKKGRLKARRTWDDWRDWVIWGMNLDSPMRVLGDQTYINAMMTKHKFNVVELEGKWNHIIRKVKFPEVPNSNFYHFVNKNKKLIPDFLKNKGWEYLYE